MPKINRQKFKAPKTTESVILSFDNSELDETVINYWCESILAISLCAKNFDIIYQNVIFVDNIYLPSNFPKKEINDFLFNEMEKKIYECESELLTNPWKRLIVRYRKNSIKFKILKTITDETLTEPKIDKFYLSTKSNSKIPVGLELDYTNNQSELLHFDQISFETWLKPCSFVKQILNLFIYKDVINTSIMNKFLNKITLLNEKA